MKLASLACGVALCLRGATAVNIVLQHEVTTPGDTYVGTRLRACGVAPRIAPGLSITGGADTTVTGAQVRFGAGHVPAEDILAVDPDPAVECAWERTCSPCFPLTVSTYDSVTGLMVSGDGSRELYASCLRRVVYNNVAYGGTETLGQREVVFTVTSHEGGDLGTTVTSTASGYAQVVPEDTEACSAALTRYATTVDNPTPPQTYYAACAGDCPDAYSAIFPDLTLTQPNVPPGEGQIQMARVLFTPCTKRGGCPGVYAPDEDMLMIHADPAVPGSTATNPCPGLLVRPHTDAAGVVNGVNITTLATPEAYQACLRRVVYWNAAADMGAATTGGDRWIGLEFWGPVTATSYTTNGRTVVMPFDNTSPCPECRPPVRFGDGGSSAPSASSTPSPSTVPGASRTPTSDAIAQASLSLGVIGMVVGIAAVPAMLG